VPLAAGGSSAMDPVRFRDLYVGGAVAQQRFCYRRAVRDRVAYALPRLLTEKVKRA
jgi:hypothetical protein